MESDTPHINAHASVTSLQSMPTIRPYSDVSLVANPQLDFEKEDRTEGVGGIAMLKVMRRVTSAAKALKPSLR